MNVKFYCFAALAAVISLSACSEEKIAPPESYMGNTIESGMSWMVPASGGDFTIALTADFVRWAEIGTWKYRVLYNGEEIDAGAATGQDLKISIPENYSAEWQKIIVEGLIAQTPGATPEWKLLASSQQRPMLTEIDGVQWAVGNLTLKDGKFASADNPEELGLYFKHMSCYGVLSDGDSYSGKCYTPEEKTVALADIPEKDGDPCIAASNGKLRLPSRYEIQKLYDAYDDVITIKGVKGMTFEDGKLFLPLAGGYNMNTGQFDFKNISGSYWYSGVNTDNSGGILAYVTEENWGLMMAYGEGEYTGSVRCVRNLRKPAYVSHSPANPADNAESELLVVTTPGDLDEYTVTLMDGPFEVVGTATAQNTTAKITIPENEDIGEVVYTLFVNGEPTGKTITQPGLTNYVFYQSHTPTGTVPADAFTLSVTCKSDMDAFDVEVKTDDGTVALKQTGSKSNLKVNFAIPANDGGSDRTLKIYVKGEYTGKTVIQERPLGFVVTWSPGYLTVKDGAYVFAGEQELGMYFKYKSRYGMTLDPTGKKYSGTAYGPAEETKAFADVNYEDVDPCTLVAPAGTWRMPTQDEWNDMLTYDFELVKDKYRAYTDKKQTVYITPSGNLNATGSSVGQPQWAKVWSTTPHVTDAGKYYYLVGTFSGETSVFNCTMGLVNNQALMVRCVR